MLMLFIIFFEVWLYLNRKNEMFILNFFIMKICCLLGFRFFLMLLLVVKGNGCKIR